MGFEHHLSPRWDDWLRKRVLRARRRRRPPAPYGPPTPPVVNGGVLCDNPGVLVILDFFYGAALQRRPDFFERWADRPALIILLRSWEIRVPENVLPMKRLVDQHRERYPNHRFVYAANEPAGMDVLAGCDFEGIYCNHNALVDEAVFRPPEGARAGDAREFDAIYDARLARFKRHDLAARVPRLALIHYAPDDLIEPLWWLAMRWRLRRAKFINRSERGFWRWPQHLNPAQVAATCNRSRVGLCLSEVEGAMLASIQYLLCGLPVVTTPSRGGRDLFFDDDNSMVVEPDPRAVADAVRRLMARNVDPWAIRARALARMEEHRRRLLDFVREFQAAHGMPREQQVGSDWAALKVNPIRDRLR